MRFLKLLLIFLVLLTSNTYAATYYMAHNGSDSAAGGTTTPWLTFSHSLAEMSSGDTLVLKAGTYTTATNGGIDTTGAYSGQPVDGTSKVAMTTIMSEGGPGTVYIQNRLSLGTNVVKKSYIKIQGVTFTGLSQFYNTTYCYVKNCGFTSNTLSTSAIFTVGTNDHDQGNTYNLVEDCWAYGQERIGMINYNCNNNVWRRCVVRTDGCNYSNGNPSVGITVYSSYMVSVQNVIVLDRLSGAGVDGQDFAGVQADPAGLFGQTEWLGCITINSEENGWMIEPTDTLTDDDYTFRMENCAAIGALYYGIGVQGTGVQHDVLIDHCTAVNNGASGIRMASNTCNDPTIRNSLSEDNGALGFYVACTNTLSEYNQAFGNASTAFSPTGSNNTSQDSVMLYLVQQGSGILTGNDALPRGADITKRYGTDGMFIDDVGYDTLSAADLWPWPNEAIIKTEFSTNYSSTDETRGFCAAGTRLDGVNPITLTSYIWEYLGNEIPADIYGETPAYDAPIVVILTESRSTTAETITIIGTLTTDSELTGSRVDVNGVTATADDGTWDESVEAWTALGVTLSLGSNTLTATGTDSESETDTDAVSITRTSPVKTTKINGTAVLKGAVIHQ